LDVIADITGYSRVIYVGDITGFTSDSSASLFCVSIINRKAWTLIVNPRFPFEESEPILIAEVITNLQV